MKCWGIEDTEEVLALKSQVLGCVSVGNVYFYYHADIFLQQSKLYLLISTPSRSTFMLLFDVRLRSNI